MGQFAHLFRAKAAAALHGAALAAAMMCAEPALAQNVPGTAYFGGSPSNIVLTVPVTASVGGRCGFQTGLAPSGSYTIPAGIDTTAWSQQFPFTLECTGPFRIAVLSTSGGLKTSPAVSSPGYADLAPYTVLMNVVRTGGTTQGTCAAADLQASASTTCALRGTASTSVGMAVSNPSYQLSGSYLQVSAPAFAGPGVLVAGTYSDTLTVTVSPSS